MNTTQKTTYQLHDTFSLTQTFECGQCFRWEPVGPETYRGIAFGREVSMSIQDSVLTVTCSESEFHSLWRPYLDLDRDYARIRSIVSIDEKTAKAVAFGAGIRILRQDPWETLCSFLLSQCNHIPRIRGIIARLCHSYGDNIHKTAYTFPSPERIAALTEEELRTVLRCGYRAPYLLAAARAVATGALDLGALQKCSTSEAKKQLLALPGIGEKVANCILLYGLGKLEAFPVDVWIRRTVQSLYGKSFDPSTCFGTYAGVAQQYLFYQARQDPSFFSMS